MEVQPIKTEDIQYIIEAVGSLEPQEEVHVTARVAGVVEKVFFEEGTKVTLQTVLAEIDRTRYQLLANRASAINDKAAAELRKAIVVIDNRQALKRKDPGWVSDEEMATLTSQLDSAKASAAEAKAAMDIANQDFENSQARSLITGTINTKNISTGQYVTPGTLIASIVDTSRLKLRFKVSEAQSVKLQHLLMGDKSLTFTVRPMPGKTFDAKLSYISPQANTQTRTVECLAIVPNPDAGLKPGFFAEVRTTVQTHSKAVVVPDIAITPTDQGFIAFVVKEGKAEQRKVTPGLFVREGIVEILDGLSEGEQLIVTGAAALRPGASLKIVDPKPTQPQESPKVPGKK